MSIVPAMSPRNEYLNPQNIPIIRSGTVTQKATNINITSIMTGMLMISFAAVYEFVISVNTDRNVILFQILGIVINY